MRLEEHHVRDLRAEWMKRCQTLGGQRMMRAVNQAFAKVVKGVKIRNWETAEVVGFI